MELREYLGIVRKRWLSVLITALTFLAATSVVTLALPEKYTATTEVFFAVPAGESVSEFAQGTTFAEKQMTSLSEVATSPLVLQPVIDRLALSVTPRELAKSISATVPADTVIIEVAATSEDPVLAARTANAIAEELSAVAGRLSPKRPDGTEAVRATILETAQVPTEPSSPNTIRNVVLGLVLGLLTGVGIAILRQVLDTKIRRLTKKFPAIRSFFGMNRSPHHPKRSAGCAPIFNSLM
jgi:succinoglycan biosynthesis transport protein ExoP